jgi:hypothetical protein
MMKNNFVIQLFLLLTYTCVGASQSTDTMSSSINSLQMINSRATLSVHASLSGVHVYVDTFSIGTVPIESIAIDTGKHILHFIHPDGNRWLYPAITETLLIHPTEHIQRIIHFPEQYFITSEPYGATVQWNDSILGQTPLRISLPSSLPVIMITKGGFQTETIPLSSDVHEVHVLLHTLQGEAGATSSMYLGSERSKSPMPLYLTTGATILTGAAAAYFKIKADNSYLDYRQNGDQSSLDSVHKFDALSGVSLAVCEVNLLLLTYLLFSR